MNTVINKYNIHCGDTIVVRLYKFDPLLKYGQYNVVVTGIYNYANGVFFIRAQLDDFEVVICDDNDELIIDYISNNGDALNYIINKHDELLNVF